MHGAKLSEVNELRPELAISNSPGPPVQRPGMKRDIVTGNSRREVRFGISDRSSRAVQRPTGLTLLAQIESVALDRWLPHPTTWEEELRRWDGRIIL